MMSALCKKTFGREREYGRIITSNQITQGLTSPIKLYNERNLQFYYLPRNSQDRALGINNIISKTFIFYFVIKCL